MRHAPGNGDRPHVTAVPERAREGWVAADPEALAREAERRRRHIERRRRILLLTTIASIVVLVVAIGAVTATIVGTVNSRAAAAPVAAITPTPTSTAFPDDKPAAAAGAEPCIAVPVLSSFENAEMVENLVAGYNAQPRDVAGNCVTVTASKDKSGVAAENAAAGFADLPVEQRPAVWIPDAQTWLSTAVAAGATLRTDPTGVGSSDIVLAMPRSLAEAIGWNDKRPTWKDIFDAAGDKELWSGLGHTEWGEFKLGKTSPVVATSGQAAMFASYGMSAGSLDGLSIDDVSDAIVSTEVQHHELATSHYMATPEHFLWHAREAEKSGSVADFLSAVIVDEKSVWDYNRGITSRDGITREQGDPPAEPLIPIYPADGFYVADNPAVVMTGNGLGTAETVAAEDFLRYTGTAQAQKIVRESGYRDLHGELDPGVTSVASLATAPKGAVGFPEPGVINAIDAAFPNVRKRAQVLFLVDVSGSMNETIGNGQTKMDAAKDAISSALSHFTAGDSLGLAAFAADLDGKTGPGIVSPVADLGTSEAQFTSALAGLTAFGDTPLYEAVDSTVAAQSAAWAPDRINAVVLLSDGKNDMKRETVSAQQMLDDLQHLHHNGTPVLVFTLAYGADADVATLQSISSATGAHYYDATDPTKLKSVLGDLVTSF